MKNGRVDVVSPLTQYLSRLLGVFLLVSGRSIRGARTSPEVGAAERL
jgi:hypothetical protein